MRVMCFHLLRPVDRWVLCDETGSRILRGRVGASRLEAFGAWARLHGTPEGMLFSIGSLDAGECASIIASLAEEARLKKDRAEGGGPCSRS